MLVTISDLVLDLLKYDRRDDPDLPAGVIEDLVESGELTVEEMVTAFRTALQKKLPKVK